MSGYSPLGVQPHSMRFVEILQALNRGRYLHQDLQERDLSHNPSLPLLKKFCLKGGYKVLPVSEAIARKFHGVFDTQLARGGQEPASTLFPAGIRGNREEFVAAHRVIRIFKRHLRSKDQSSGIVTDINTIFTRSRLWKREIVKQDELQFIQSHPFALIRANLDEKVRARKRIHSGNIVAPLIEKFRMGLGYNTDDEVINRRINGVVQQVRLPIEQVKLPMSVVLAFLLNPNLRKELDEAKKVFDLIRNYRNPKELLPQELAERNVRYYQRAVRLQEHVPKLEKIVAFLKSWAVCRFIVLPFQIKYVFAAELDKPFVGLERKNPGIGRKFLGKIDTITWIVCREILEMAQIDERVGVKDKRRRLYGTDRKEYRFPLFEERKNSHRRVVRVLYRTLQSKVNEWNFKIKRGGPHRGDDRRPGYYRVQMILGKIGGGGFKTVYISKHFDIQIAGGKNRSIKYYPTILSRTEGAEEVDTVKKGLAMRQRLEAVFNPASNVAVPPMDMVEGGSGASKFLEIEQIWYNGDLSSALEHGYPEDIEGSLRRQLTLPERINILVDLAKVLEIMHTQFIVHRDLKTLNVLISTRAGYPSARLADWDLAGKFGFDNFENSRYPFWPICSQNGWGLPVCDSYGLAMILGELIFGNVFYTNFACRRDNFKGADGSTSVAYEKLLLDTIAINVHLRIQEARFRVDVLRRVLEVERDFEVDAALISVFRTEAVGLAGAESARLTEIETAKNNIFSVLGKLRDLDGGSYERQVSPIINEAKNLMLCHQFIFKCVRGDDDLNREIRRDRVWQDQLKMLRSHPEAHPEAIERLYKYIPSMKQLREWCEQLHGALKQGTEFYDAADAASAAAAPRRMDVGSLVGSPGFGVDRVPR